MTGLRILIVEDNPDCAESMAMLLRLYGHEVEVARNSSTAWEKAQDHQADVVLLDIRLPGMLVAVIARPPVVGGRVARYDPKPALAIPGVKRVVEIPTPKPPYGFQPPEEVSEQVGFSGDNFVRLSLVGGQGADEVKQAWYFIACYGMDV